MQITDVRLVPAATGEVWTALHDSPRGQAGDSYRGTFAIDDTDPGTELVLSVPGRGRCGHLELNLRVRLEPGRPPTPQCWPTKRRPGSAVSPPVSGEPR